MALALVLAGSGALGYGSASALQAVAARRRAGVLRTMVHPMYVVGSCLDLLAWLSSLVALRTLPVFEVQSVLTGSLAVTAVAVRLTLGIRLGRTGVLAVGLCATALTALALSAGPEHTTTLDPAQRAGLALAVLPIAGLGWVCARSRWSGACGVTAGLAFGGAALCARALLLPPHAGADLAHTARLLAAEPLAGGVVGFGLAGMCLYATALEHGDPTRVTALLWLAEVVVPSIVGVVLLGDRVRAGLGPVAAGAVAACLVAGWLLSREPEPDDGPFTVEPATDGGRQASPPPPAPVR